MRYAFLGLGRMAGAILSGMERAGLLPGNEVWGFDTDSQKTRALQEQLGLTGAASAAEALRAAQVLVLAVKPQTLAGLLPEVRANLSRGTLVISIAAGKPLSFYEKALEPATPVIRAMPNLNARVGGAVTAVCANAYASQAQRALALELFGCVGTVKELPEEQMSAFSAVAGAAPAFVFLFLDALAAAGVRAGLPRELALEVAADMALGSAKMVLESGEHPCALADQVCSPGGTTIEGMHALKRLGFEGALHEAVAAVLKKDRLLGG